jgi:glycosyltransferase involved in cell wall biosynthesis
LQDHLRWLGELEDPLPHLAAADVLVMTSREDPRPMVPMEAALVGTPTAGFSVGGLIDMNAHGAALVAPYPDVVGLAERIGDLLDDAGLRAATAGRAAERASSEQGIDVVGPQFVEHLRSLLDRSTTPHPGSER